MIQTSEGFKLRVDARYRAIGERTEDPPVPGIDADGYTLELAPSCEPGRVTRGCKCLSCDAERNRRLTYKQRIRASRRSAANR